MTEFGTPSPTLAGFDAQGSASPSSFYGAHLYDASVYGRSGVTLRLAAVSATFASFSSSPVLLTLGVAETPSSAAVVADGWGQGGWGLTAWGGGSQASAATGGPFNTAPSFMVFSSSPQLAVIA